MILARLSACALLLAAVAGAQDVRDLAARIAKEKDRVDPAVFGELAAIGSLESLEALEGAIERLKTLEALTPAYEAFALYAGAEPADGARQFLARESFRARNREARPVVVRALRAFGDDSLPVLERVLADHPDPACRTLACDPLVLLLAARCDAASLTLVLDHATVGWDPAPAPIGVDARARAAYAGLRQRDVVRAALEACREPEVEALLAARLADASAPRAWKLLLVEVLAGRDGEAYTRALAGALDDPDPSVATAALEQVVRRDDAAGLGPELEPLYRSPEPALRRAAVVALGRLELTDAEWRERILELSRARDPALRMGAAVALAHVRTPEALARLFELCADDEWPVRAEALEAVALLREKDSVPVLLERMRVETGRMRRDVHAALRAVTGLDLGRRLEPWQLWWEREGERFEAPSAEEVLEAERAAAEREAERAGTVASSFYGARVESERVCFVLDVSGTMNTNAGPGVDPAGPQDPTKASRLDVARDELAKIVRVLPDGTLFNLIFFETEVRALAPKLQKMKKKTRQTALRMIRDQYALGATALYPALELAFADPLVDTIWLLSDGAPTVGEVTDIEAVREEVRRWNAARKVRIHGITVGQDSTLLRWLTEDTGGTYVRRD